VYSPVGRFAERAKKDIGKIYSPSGKFADRAELLLYGSIRREEAEMLKNIDTLDVVPVIDDQPLRHGDLVGDALSVISMKQSSDWTADSDSVVKRQSFRCLHRPDLASLSWVSQADNKEQVLASMLYRPP